MGIDRSRIGPGRCVYHPRLRFRRFQRFTHYGSHCEAIGNRCDAFTSEQVAHHFRTGWTGLGQRNAMRQNGGQVRLHAPLFRRFTARRSRFRIGTRTTADIMQRGELVPLIVVLDLLKEAMLSKLATSKGFLIDGYPREVAQGIQFEEEICPCALVLYFQVSDETMTKRLMGRGLTSGRADDNIDTIRKRLDTFHKHSLPVVDHYGTKCKTISAEVEPDAVFLEVAKALEQIK